MDAIAGLTLSLEGEGDSSRRRFDSSPLTGEVRTGDGVVDSCHGCLLPSFLFLGLEASASSQGSKFHGLGENISGGFIRIRCPYDLHDLPDLMRVFLPWRGFDTAVDVHRARPNGFYRRFYILLV